jgi:hypothetical protein
MDELKPLAALPVSASIETAAEELILRLMAHYSTLLPEKTPADFTQELLNPFSIASSEEPATITFNREDGAYRGFAKYMQHIIEALATGNDACRAHEEGDSENAWPQMARAFYLLGRLEGLMVVEPAVEYVSATRSKSGASKRDAKFEPLRQFARELATKRNYASRRNAALSIKDQVLSRAKELNINLSADQAERTITKWLDGMTFAAKR